jgi:hypothetical protein
MAVAKPCLKNPVFDPKLRRSDCSLLLHVTDMDGGGGGGASSFSTGALPRSPVWDVCGRLDGEIVWVRQQGLAAVLALLRLAETAGV